MGRAVCAEDGRVTSADVSQDIRLALAANSLHYQRGTVEHANRTDKQQNISRGFGRVVTSAKLCTQYSTHAEQNQCDKDAVAFPNHGGYS